MTSGSILSLTPLAERSEPSAAWPITESPQIVRLAAQLRGLRKGNKRVILFSPIGENLSAENLVERLAQYLFSMDRAPVVVLSLHPRGKGDEGSKALPAPVRSASETIQTTRRTLPEVILPGVHMLNLLDVSARKDASLTSVITQLRGQADYVLIDAPGLLHNALTPIAVEAADGVILLVQEGKSSMGEMGETRRQLLALHASITGFVFIQRAHEAGRDKT